MHLVYYIYEGKRVSIIEKGRPSAGGSHMSGVWGREKPRQAFPPAKSAERLSYISYCSDYTLGIVYDTLACGHMMIKECFI